MDPALLSLSLVDQVISPLCCDSVVSPRKPRTRRTLSMSSLSLKEAEESDESSNEITMQASSSRREIAPTDCLALQPRTPDRQKGSSSPRQVERFTSVSPSGSNFPRRGGVSDSPGNVMKFEGHQDTMNSTGGLPWPKKRCASLKGWLTVAAAFFFKV